jgi:hypothetical protein
MTSEQQAFVDEVKRVCTDNYEAGGDTIIECYTDEQILKEFKTMDEVKDFCGLQVESALNARWGDDDDPELERSEAFEGWKS